MATSSPHIFVSHSHQDDEYCRAFVDELRQLCGERGAVWYDEHNLTSGELLTEIQRQLHQRPIFVVILSPAALHTSSWVKRECAWAYELYEDTPGRTILPVTAEQIEPNDFLPDWLYLRGFRRIEATGLKPFPPKEAALRTMEAIPQSPVSVAPGVAPLPSVTPPPPGSAPVKLPPELFPSRLEQLGFAAYVSPHGVEYILPPLCHVPAGPFLMGSNQRDDPEAKEKEQPRHPVTLPAFQIAKFPVTIAEYACFLRDKPDVNHNKPLHWPEQLTRLDHPVVSVHYYFSVLSYRDWLAGVTKQPWRLPTGAEWEKAARGTDGRTYPWGGAFDKNCCNTAESGIKATTPVGAYPCGASPYGTQDMAGNVWEWTGDPTIPAGHDGNGRPTCNRTMRGGSWDSSSSYARAACSEQHWEMMTSQDWGFRLILATPSP